MKDDLSDPLIVLRTLCGQKTNDILNKVIVKDVQKYAHSNIDK